MSSSWAYKPLSDHTETINNSLLKKKKALLWSHLQVVQGPPEMLLSRAVTHAGGGLFSAVLPSGHLCSVNYLKKLIASPR